MRLAPPLSSIARRNLIFDSQKHVEDLPGALVTAVFILIPVLGGGWVLSLALRRRILLTAWRRVLVAVTGLLGLVTWAGFIVGPVILFGLSVIPSRVTTE